MSARHLGLGTGAIQCQCAVGQGDAERAAGGLAQGRGADMSFQATGNKRAHAGIQPHHFPFQPTTLRLVHAKQNARITMRGKTTITEGSAAIWLKNA